MSQRVGEVSPLERYGHDLTAMAHAGHFQPLLGYDQWIARVIEILIRARPNKCNPAILGLTHDEGWPIVAEVVRRMATGDVPEFLALGRVVALDWEALVANIAELEALKKQFAPRAGTVTIRYPIEEMLADEAIWEAFLEHISAKFERMKANPIYQRLEAIFDVVRRSEGRVILYVRSLHRLLGGETDRYPIDAFNLLKPALAQREIQIIGTCSLDAYRRYIERDVSIQRWFQEVLTQELLEYGGRKVL